MIHFCAHGHAHNVQKAARKGGGPAGRPRRAVTNTYKKLTALSNRMGSAIQVDMVKGIKTFKKKVSADAIYDAWRTGNYERVMASIPWQALPEDLEDMTDGIGQTYGDAANFQIEKLPPQINQRLRFDTSNPMLKGFIQRRTGELIRGIQSDVQTTVQNAVARSFNEALTPRQVALQIKGSIGLLPQHERALANYRQSLMVGGVAPGRVEKLADQYENKLLDYRANTIARTETRFATNQGQLAVWHEGAKQGYIDKATAKKEWVVDGDPCETCEPMDGIKVALDDAWTLEYPNGDIKAVYIPTEAHPNCMCGMELHFDDTAEGDDE